MANSFVLTLKNSKEWCNLLENCEESDIHFDPNYLMLFEKKMNGKSLLFVTKEKENFLLYPFFKRRINDIPYFSDLDEELYDIISPWYFGGPILQNSKNSKKLVEQFLKEFKEYTNNESIVTEFTRIHPLLKYSRNFADQVNAEYRYDTAYVNLIQSKEEILKNFKKSNRNASASSERRGIQIEFSTSEKAIDEFYFLYARFIKQIKTSSFYEFPIDFLKKIRISFNDNFVVALARYDQKVIAGSIFLFKGGIVHYWLSTTDNDFRNMYPTNLLLSKAIFWFKERGEKKFFLMGGTEEKLRKFKESFSNTVVKFYTYSKIYDNKNYLHLVSISNKTNKIKNEGFFPEYRE